MPGSAKTTSFMLSTATVMIGTQASLHVLTPASHSMGLVKNVVLTADPKYVELTSGLRNTTVMSVKTEEGLKISGELYEYTQRNIAYLAGLDGNSTKWSRETKLYALSMDTVGAATSCKIDEDVTADISAGDYIFIQEGSDDRVHIARVASVAFATGASTITFASGFALPTGAQGVFTAVNGRVGKVKRIDLGNQLVQPEFCAKIVGILPKSGDPFTILLPKVKVTKGVSINFNSDNFSSLPLELTPYANTPEDPYYSEYGEATAILFPR